MAVKFTYFPLMARGTASVIALELSEMEWTASSVEFADWPALKGSGICPFGQLPILETPDGVVAQSSAICTYIGRKKNMLGADEKEKIVSDMLVGAAEDIYADLQKNQPTIIVQEKSAEDLAKMWAGGMADRLKNLEKLMGAHADKFTASGTTIGEISLFAMVHQMVLVRPELLKEHAKLNAWYTRFLNLAPVQKVLTGKSAFGPAAQYFVNP